MLAAGALSATLTLSLPSDVKQARMLTAGLVLMSLMSAVHVDAAAALGDPQLLFDRGLAVSFEHFYGSHLAASSSGNLIGLCDADQRPATQQMDEASCKTSARTSWLLSKPPPYFGPPAMDSALTGPPIPSIAFVSLESAQWACLASSACEGLTKLPSLVGPPTWIGHDSSSATYSTGAITYHKREADSRFHLVKLRATGQLLTDTFSPYASAGELEKVAETNAYGHNSSEPPQVIQGALSLSPADALAGADHHWEVRWSEHKNSDPLASAAFLVSAAGRFLDVRPYDAGWVSALGDSDPACCCCASLRSQLEWRFYGASCSLR